MAQIELGSLLVAEDGGRYTCIGHAQRFCRFLCQTVEGERAKGSIFAVAIPPQFLPRYKAATDWRQDSDGRWSGSPPEGGPVLTLDPQEVELDWVLVNNKGQQQSTYIVEVDDGL